MEIIKHDSASAAVAANAKSIFLFLLRAEVLIVKKIIHASSKVNLIVTRPQ